MGSPSRERVLLRLAGGCPTVRLHQSAERDTPLPGANLGLKLTTLEARMVKLGIRVLLAHKVVILAPLDPLDLPVQLVTKEIVVHKARQV